MELFLVELYGSIVEFDISDFNALVSVVVIKDNIRMEKWEV